MSRYWIYIDAKIQGPFEVNSLRRAPGFNLLSQVCLEGQKTWSLADDVLEIKSYFLSPPRVSSLPLEMGNTALKVEAEVEASAPPRMGSPLAVLSMGDNLVEELPPLKGGAPAVNKKDGPVAAPAPVAEGKPGSLRALCEVCGYKNPRDVSICMKCGTPIAAAAKPEAAPEAVEAAKAPLDKKPEETRRPLAVPEPATPILEHKIIAPSPLRHLWIGLAVSLLAIGGFLGMRSWKKHQALKKDQAIPLIRMPPEIAPSSFTLERALAAIALLCAHGGRRCQSVAGNYGVAFRIAHARAP